MKLSSLLSPKQVILDLKGETCAHALVHMVDHLVSRGLLDASLRDEVLNLLEEREGQVSTGIGSGVAIPHAFSDSIDHVIAVFGRSSEGIDFEASTGKENIDKFQMFWVFSIQIPLASAREVKTSGAAQSAG